MNVSISKDLLPFTIAGLQQKRAEIDAQIDYRNTLITRRNSIDVKISEVEEQIKKLTGPKPKKAA